MLLLLHHGAIGDFLLTLSVAGEVRQHLGRPRFAVIASAASARWAAAGSIVDLGHSPESVGLHTLFAPETPLDNRLSHLLGQATVILNFLGRHDESIHNRLVTATAGQVISVDPRPTPATLASGLHITDQWAADVRSQGLQIDQPIPPRIRCSSGSNAQPIVIIHPGSGGRQKCWPIEQFMNLADALARHAMQIAWMLGPAEREPDNDRFAAIAQRTAATGEELIVEDDLAGAAARIADAKLYIGNDGGMTHVAAATGTPTLAIYVATDPRVWRPLGENVSAIDARAETESSRDRVLAQASSLIVKAQ